METNNYTFHINFTTTNEARALFIAGEFAHACEDTAEWNGLVTVGNWDVSGVDSDNGHLDWSVIIPRPIQKPISDHDALNAIASWLSVEQWSADDLDRIADIVRATGRVVEDV